MKPTSRRPLDQACTGQRQSSRLPRPPRAKPSSPQKIRSQVPKTSTSPRRELGRTLSRAVQAAVGHHHHRCASWPMMRISMQTVPLRADERFQQAVIFFSHLHRNTNSRLRPSTASTSPTVAMTAQYRYSSRSATLNPWARKAQVGGWVRRHQAREGQADPLESFAAIGPSARRQRQRGDVQAPHSPGKQSVPWRRQDQAL